jgi:hypothetical protein
MGMPIKSSTAKAQATSSIAQRPHPQRRTPAVASQIVSSLIAVVSRSAAPSDGLIVTHE